MISDDTLSAYLDGEASEAERRDIDERLSQDPALASRIEALRQRDGEVRAGFDALLDAPGLPDLEARIRALSAAQAPPSNVVAFPARKAPRTGWVWPSLVAASLVAGVLLGRLSGAPSPAAGSLWVADSGGAPRAGVVLAKALSAAPSGSPFDLGKGRSGEATLTFARQDGALCRQFQVRGGDGAQNALACRESAGAWRMVAVASAATASAGGYQTAAGPGQDAVSAAADRLIAGEPMDAAQEAAALARR